MMGGIRLGFAGKVSLLYNQFLMPSRKNSPVKFRATVKREAMIIEVPCGGKDRAWLKILSAILSIINEL
jgi:hypothetical protein